MVLRQSYLDKIERYLGKDLIIVLVGQRRVGKSFILRLFREKVAADGVSNVIYVDKEKREYDQIKTYADLNLYIEEHRVYGRKNYILVDEIQEISEFEQSIRNYRTEDDCEVIITGSNSNMLSSELSTLIGGRYKEIYVHALSYEEYLQFHSLPDNDESLALYIQFGGLPGLLKIGLQEDDAREYQLDIYNSVLLKDVVRRNNIRNVIFLENLVRFIADNCGKLISANSIAKYIKSQGESVTSSAIISYAKYLCSAYMLHQVNRYDIHGKRLFESNDKYYFEDHGIRNALAGGSREGDIEKVLENIVYNQLLRLGYSVTVGQLQSAEIDFVGTKPNGDRVYVQVAYIVTDADTRKREFGNLHNIKDNYPKYVISMTPLLFRSTDDGVVHLHLRNFLKYGL